MFLRIKDFVLWIAENIAQMTSVVERLHSRSNEGFWMDGVRKIATRITVLHVTDNKANKVSRGRTTKLVTSCKVCSGRLVKRHCWFGKSTDDAVWFKDSFACNKQSKHSSTLIVRSTRLVWCFIAKNFTIWRSYTNRIFNWTLLYELVCRKSTKSRLITKCLFIFCS